MKKRYRLTFVAIALFTLIFSGRWVWAGDSEITRATLAGVQGLRVIVEELQPNIQKHAAKFNLTSQQIRKEVEQRLRDAGIRVVEGQEWLNTPGRPVLAITINTHGTEKYWYAYDIKIELCQIVFLEADPKVKTLASTWSIGITGSANVGNLNLIRQDVGVMVGRFIQAYKSKN